MNTALDRVQLVVFAAGGELYGLTIQQVREVVPAASYHITPVPLTPPHVRGVMNLRGRVVPVMDLRVRLGLPPAPVTPATRIVMVEGEPGTVGMVVDRVVEVLWVDGSDVQPPSPVVAQGGADFLAAVARAGDRIIGVLDLDRVLAREERGAGREDGQHGAGV